MKKRFWYPTIENDKDAHTATIWSCFGYVWIGGGEMLLALLNSAGWIKLTGETPEAGIAVGIFALIFGWFTWKQSFPGTIVGFILWGLLNVGGALMSVYDGEFGTSLRGSGL